MKKKQIHAYSKDIAKRMAIIQALKGRHHDHALSWLHNNLNTNKFTQSRQGLSLGSTNDS